jgi:hypothetical protein
VEIFADDTVTVSLTVAVEGEMRVSLRGDAFYQRGKSFVVTTPAWLVVNGVGVATIASLDSVQRLAVVPRGLAPDSAEALTVVGSIVRLSRGAGETRVRTEALRR